MKKIIYILILLVALGHTSSIVINSFSNNSNICLIEETTDEEFCKLDHKSKKINDDFINHSFLVNNIEEKLKSHNDYFIHRLPNPLLSPDLLPPNS